MPLNHVAAQIGQQGVLLGSFHAFGDDGQVEAIERCSGHDGTYAIKQEFHEVSMKIVKPVANRVGKAEPDAYTSDCPMAGHHISASLDDGSSTEHPISLLRRAYGI